MQANRKCPSESGSILSYTTPVISVPFKTAKSHVLAVMGLLLNAFLILYLFNFFQTGVVTVDFHLQKNYHEPRAFNSEELTEVAKLSSLPRFDEILSHILVPRVVGSDGHRKVREYITSQLRGLGWSVEHQESVQTTPLFGQLTFTNLIARLNPSADRYLTLACHYDSKHMREGEFLAATDSAVPCAMMLDLAHALSHRLEPFKKSNLSLMLLFFDGEEAFVTWSATDSLYGSRSLAQTWEKRKYPHARSDTTELHRIDLLVLLDLLGYKSPTFISSFADTHEWYQQIMSAEQRLHNQKLLVNHPRSYFFDFQLNLGVGDDHVPFLERGVSVVHVIPTPFPEVWHELSDNYENLDFDVIQNLIKILYVFTLEYLEGTTNYPIIEEL
ncbi:glutaminyl-peptide cyclotransferase-like isoform X2 [Macrosteles quadrilineatus]|uniref:glutaminyl-peptide cyclotransferase-like isoform X2 n=1 Tax=Macrosteles quadrilineatus TaxID=74068 RepID=UPI0023E09D8D|nr:glutaminyl-peptide cyclotransferase-like isoform X2 [Macrosteles quadrilineatus]